MRASRRLGAEVWDSLLTQWHKLSRAAAGRRQEAALRLLSETVSCVKGDSPARISAQSSSSSSHSIRTPIIPTAAGSKLLGNRDASLLIWQALRRQRVPWSATLQLFTHQCAYLSDEKAAWARRFASNRPSQHALAALRAWERVDDVELVACYARLKTATSVVAFAQIVSAALRSRPQLNGVLPVPRAALAHLYDLATLPEMDRLQTGPDGQTTSAAIALKLCEHLAVLQSASLSVRAREALDLDYAALRAHAGQWSAALAVVTHSPFVRASTKVAWRTFVTARGMWEEALRLPTISTEMTLTAPTAPTPGATDDVVGRVETAVRAAPQWQQALAVVQSLASPVASGGACDVEAPLHGAAVAALLSRRDAAGPTGALNWHEQVRLFCTLTPEQQTFAVARTVLAAVPQNDPQYLPTAVAVLRASTLRMYAGTLARRYHSALRTGEWGMALALSLASDSFDLAAAVLSVPEAAQKWGSAGGSSDRPGHCDEQLRWPTEWVRYQHVCDALNQKSKQTTRAQRVTVIIAHDIPRCTTTAERVAVLLAVALHGGVDGWRAVQKDPLCHQHARLRAYVTARQLEALSDARVADNTMDASVSVASSRADIACFLFERPSDTALVALWAPDTARTYFLKVIPAALRHALLQSLARAKTDAAAAELGLPAPTQCATDAATREPETIEETVRTLYRLVSTARHPPGSSFAQRLARAAACGDLVALVPPACRPGIALAALSVRSSASLPCGLDAAATVAAASMSLALRISHPIAMQRTIEARLMLGQWQRALQELARWRAHASTTGTLPEQLPRVLEATRLCACHAPRPVALELITEALHLAGLSSVTAADSVADPRVRAAVRDGASPPLAVPAQRLLLQAVLDLLTASDTRQMEGLLASTPRPSADRKRKALSATFCLLSETRSLRRVLRAAGQERVGVLDLDHHAAQRLVLALPPAAALSALTTWAAHGRVVHEHWVVLLLARCPLSDRARPDQSDTPHNTLRSFQPHSLTVSAVVSAKLAAFEGDLCGFLVALKRVTNLLLCTSRGLQHPGRPVPLGSHATTAIVYLLRDILDRFVETPASSADQIDHIQQHTLTWYHVLCRDPHLSRALLDRGGGLVASLTTTHGWSSSHSLASPSSSVARAVLLLGYIHRVLARHARIPIAAAMTARQLHLCAQACPEAWQVALYLFRQLRSPRREECEALFTALAHAPTEQTEPGRDATAARSAVQQAVASLTSLVCAFPEQALIWAPSDAAMACAEPRWRQALEWLGARRVLEPHSSGEAARESPADEQAFMQALGTHLDTLTVEGREEVQKCLQHAKPVQSDRVYQCLLTNLARHHHHNTNNSGNSH